jgi:hypothetical protein
MLLLFYYDKFKQVFISAERHQRELRLLSAYKAVSVVNVAALVTRYERVRTNRS